MFLAKNEVGYNDPLKKQLSEIIVNVMATNQ